MKVVLINPPSPYLDDDAAYPPTGLMYLAASIEQGDHEVEIVDLTGGVLPVASDDADLYGITCVTPDFPIVKTIVENLPGPTIIGGPHPTFLPLQTLDNTKCDAVVIGEGEVVIHQILTDVACGKLQRFYHGDNVAPTDVPRPARHLVDLKKYRSAATVYTSRGCPFNCAFCSKITGRTYRAFPEDRVVEEVIDLIDVGFDHIIFGDDDISIGIPRLERLLVTLQPLGITFRLNQDARDIDEAIIKLAASSGCTEISFGIESGSQSMLNAMNKRTTVEANKRAIEVVKSYGIKAKAYFMVNFPGETEATVRATIEFIEATRPDNYLISAFAPLPGSPIFKNPEKYGIIWMSEDWSRYYLAGNDFKPCFATKSLSPERQIYLYNLLKGELEKA